MKKRETGALWEKRAAAYLEGRGMKLKELNFRCRQGEIDIIGYHEGYLVFVEVKYRSSLQKGSAAEAVNFAKQKTICRVADYYRAVHGLGSFIPVRYDVVAVQGDEISWIQNAFAHVGAFL